MQIVKIANMRALLCRVSMISDFKLHSVDCYLEKEMLYLIFIKFLLSQIQWVSERRACRNGFYWVRVCVSSLIATCSLHRWSGWCRSVS